jgi:octaprenyl-diphosphate synthase
MGKNVGDDLAEGKPTLPLIYAMQQANPAQLELLTNAIKEGSLTYLPDILATIASTQAIEYTYAAARREALAAIEALHEVPDSPYRDALIDLAKFTLERHY